MRGYIFRPCGADRGLLSVVVNFPPRPSLIVIKLFVQQQEERKGRGAALCHL